MAGYTPLFSSLITGTLYGRWPDIGLWPIVLSLADKNGIVDVTPRYLAGVTGLQLDAVVACMGRFCEPDPHSRSKAENGARLVLIDPARDWGWLVVNHTKYREKARLQAKNAREVEEGREAERKRHSRMSAAVRRGPPLSDPSNANADSDVREERSGRVPSLNSIRQSSSLNSEPDDLQKSLGEGKRKAAEIAASVRRLAQSKRVQR